ncbi:hypothetical protein [Parabacteroides bouchesdurhonensis]|uniref:hypothetical protein n=1 Tax=Parabacteroides bouchesdurhonensis TaxID=1936995 RepID=UPI000E50038C|nr:hypothetical protein [Parabacteroides bouchesdurhonensis]RHJ94881.1 hypothetical protein DW095_00080 [Bacteroides sp. AM07-16]
MKKVISLMAIAILMSACDGDDGMYPPPPIPPGPVQELVTIDLKVQLENNAVETDPSVLFVSKWNEGHRLFSYSAKSQEALDASTKSEGAETRTSVMSPFTSFYLVDGIGLENAAFKGSVVKGDDSLVVFRVSRELLQLNYVSRHYKTDSIPEVFRFDDLMMGTAKIDTVNGTTITMKHITSVLDVKLINKTGIDLMINKVIIHPADPDSKPFYSTFEECIYSYGKVDRGSSGALTAEYSKGYVENGDTFTVRHPLFLLNESVLEGKALIISIITDHGMYSYTKTGKKYEGGMHHVEEVILEGQ